MSSVFLNCDLDFHGACHPGTNRHSRLDGKYQLTSSSPFIRTPTGVMVYLTVSVACTISFT